MKLSISEVARLFNISVSSIRWYEKHGVIPSVKRDENGYRYFDEEDLDWLSVVMCMKGTNMSIENIQKFASLNAKGDSTLSERLKMVQAQRESVLSQIQELNGYLHTIDFKIMYFTACIKEGTEANMKKKYYPGPVHSHPVTSEFVD